MATTEKCIEMSNRLKSIKNSENPEVNHIIAGADDIYDDVLEKKQSEINNQIEGYTNEKYVSVTATALTTAVTDVLPATGDKGTIYRVGSWDGTQYDTDRYSEYAWDGSAYVLLNVKDFGIDATPVEGSSNAVMSGSVYDAYAHQVYLEDDSAVTPVPEKTIENDTVWNTSGSQVISAANQKAIRDNIGVTNELALGGVYDVTAHNGGTTFASLSALLNDANLSTLIPLAIRKGGMSIKFEQTSDNKYVQFRYMLEYADTTERNATFIDLANWQGVDVEPIAGSKNLMESGGVYSSVLNTNKRLGGLFIPDLSIEQGRISPSSGADSSSNIWIRTSNYIECWGISIEMSGNQVCVSAYKNDGTHIKCIEGITESAVIHVDGADKYRLTFGYNPSANITPSDFNSLGITIKSVISGEFVTRQEFDNDIAKYVESHSEELAKAGSVYSALYGGDKSNKRYNGSIATSGSWGNINTQATMAIIPCTAGTVITIEGPAYYSFLSYVDFYNKTSTGISGECNIQVSSDTTVIITAPQGTNYIAIRDLLADGTTSVFPKKLIIDGLNYIIKGLKSEIDEEIDELEDYIKDISADFDSLITTTTLTDSKTFSGTGSNVNNFFKADFANGVKYRITIDEQSTASNQYNLRVYSQESVAGSGLIAYVGTIDIDSKKHILYYGCESDNAIYLNVQSTSSVSGTSYSFDIKIESVGAFSELEERVDYLGESTDYPEYYNYAIQTCIASVRQKNLLSGSNGDSFVFLTDIHFPSGTQYGPQIANMVSRYTNNKMLVHGGDFISTNNTKADYINILHSYMYIIQLCYGKNYRVLYGNHDINTQDAQGDETQYITDSEFYALACKGFENEVINPQAKLYYYWDNLNQNIRYVCFNSGVDGSSELLTPQFSWFEALVANAITGCRFVVMVHMIYNNNSGQWASSRLHSLMDLLDAVNTRGAVTIGGVTYDFSNTDVEVSCVLTGHVHSGYRTTYGTSQIPVIAMCADMTGTTGSVNEHRINFVDLDYTRRKIYVYQLGKDAGYYESSLSVIPT